MIYIYIRTYIHYKKFVETNGIYNIDFYLFVK